MPAEPCLPAAGKPLLPAGILHRQTCDCNVSSLLFLLECLLLAFPPPPLLLPSCVESTHPQKPCSKPHTLISSSAFGPLPPSFSAVLLHILQLAQGTAGRLPPRPRPQRRQLERLAREELPWEAAAGSGRAGMLCQEPPPAASRAGRDCSLHKQAANSWSWLLPSLPLCAPRPGRCSQQGVGRSQPAAAACTASAPGQGSATRKGSG